MDPNQLPVADSAPYHDALAQCVDHWRLAPEKTALLRDGVNHVFASETLAGAPVIVRVSDGSLRERGELDGELLWLDHLIRHGCTVTTPIRSRAGTLLETIDLDAGTYHVCCFERFGGRQLDPKADRAWNDELMLQLGREIARIHRSSDALCLPPGRDRHQWYESKMSVFPYPLPDCYNRRVADAMSAFTDEMRARPRTPRHYGLVHRDIHSGNFLLEDGRVEIIDFDLGCYGWRLMDFAVLLFSHYYFPSLAVPGSTPALAGSVLATLVRGYRQEYALDDEHLLMIGDLLKLREILNYVVTAPAVEHWQVAMGNPEPTVAQSVKWIEHLWQEGRELEVDLSWL
jgi:Ser/Thr protein kinase RdoA (MazF antagonist)